MSIVDEPFAPPAPPAERPTGAPVSPEPSPPPEPDGNEALAKLLLGIVGIFFAYLIARAIDEQLALPITVVLLIAGLILYPKIIRKQQVIERWDLLIPGAQGNAESVTTGTLARLDAMQLPSVSQERQQLAPGVLRGLAGHRRPFLVVTHGENRRLTPYRMYVNVRDYGNTLQTSWYLTYRPNIFRRVMPTSELLGLDLFDEQDLRAYVAGVHLCFTGAVIDLLASLGQDTSLAKKATKGFLGIA